MASNNVSDSITWNMADNVRRHEMAHFNIDKPQTKFVFCNMAFGRKGNAANIVVAACIVAARWMIG